MTCTAGTCFGKLMVTDPQQDWDTALARIYAAVRP